MKKRLIAMFLVLALVLMTVVVTAAAAHTHVFQRLGPLDKGAPMNYGSGHITKVLYMDYCNGCGYGVNIWVDEYEPHTLPCSVCGGVTFSIEEPEEEA